MRVSQPIVSPLTCSIRHHTLHTVVIYRLFVAIEATASGAWGGDVGRTGATNQESRKRESRSEKRFLCVCEGKKIESH